VRADELLTAFLELEAGRVKILLTLSVEGWQRRACAKSVRHLGREFT
jgi:hypothetical protein